MNTDRQKIMNLNLYVGNTITIQKESKNTGNVRDIIYWKLLGKKNLEKFSGLGSSNLHR